MIQRIISSTVLKACQRFTLLALPVSVLLTGIPTQLLAESITVPVGSQAAGKQSVARPNTGTSGTDVVSRFGEPLAVNSPIGDPPISRWEYADFYVYFEYDRVIHSVLKQEPKS